MKASFLRAINKKAWSAFGRPGFFFVAEGGLFHDPQVGSFCKEKALHPPSASVGSFRFYPSLEQAQLCLKTKIPIAFATGLFFVDKRFEISNLNLIRDMMELVELAEVL